MRKENQIDLRRAINQTDCSRTKRLESFILKNQIVMSARDPRDSSKPNIRLFVLLDSKNIYIDGKGGNKGTFPVFDFVNKGFQNVYELINTTFSSFKVLSDYNILKQKLEPNCSHDSSLNVEMTEEKGDKINQVVCRGVFGCFRKRLEEKILTYLHRLKKSNSDDEAFFQGSDKTMLFGNHPSSISLSEA